ncbi:MAG: DUF72 domain-containing protein [candidate division WOR-3 bacterium]
MSVRSQNGEPRLRVGTSGFSFADWVGPVYPKNLPRAMMLEYYEQVLGFDTVELNFTYYSMPKLHTMESLVKRTRDNFRFVVRSHREMTHDIWEEGGESNVECPIPDTGSQSARANTRSRAEGVRMPASRGRGRMKDLSMVFRQFREGLVPLMASGKLGCVLVQLPSFFWPSPDSRDYLARLRERLPGVPVVVEFRNKAWVRDSTYRTLTEIGIGYCVVDEPQLPRLMPFDPRRTSDIAYFRFHGRNRHWFKASREERYNYLYSRDELADFVEPLEATISGARQAFAFFNNCHAGAAARNAVMMKQLLGLVGQLSPEQERLVNGPAEAGPDEPELPLA